MTSLPLWQVSVATRAAHESFVVECLAGVFGESTSSYFDLERGQVCVSVYREARPRQEMLRRLERALSHGSAGSRARDAGIAVRLLKPRDWVNAWKRHFKPISIGRFLLIKPSWSRTQPQPCQAVVILDPGLSFGTGQHPTTRFCLERVATLRPRTGTSSFLDVGTGSGILAIAARKLGYHPVDAIDQDATAVRIANANARRNRVQVRIRKGEVGRLRPKHWGGYDLVCANLTSDLLLEHARKIAAQVRSDGCLVLAGILRVDFDRVRAAYEDLGWRLTKTTPVREWQSGAFVAF